MEIHIRGKGRVRIDPGADYIETVKAMADGGSLTLVFPGAVCIGNLTACGAVGIDCEDTSLPIVTTQKIVGTPMRGPTDLDELWRRFFDMEAR